MKYGKTKNLVLVQSTMCGYVWVKIGKLSNLELKVRWQLAPR